MENKPENTSTAEAEKVVFEDHPPEKDAPSATGGAAGADTADKKDQTTASMTADPQPPRATA
ncbi:MAG: hypothetical protein WAK95_02995, partial [Desulfobacterales bacterium]